MGGLLPLALLGGFGGDRKRRDAGEDCVPGDEGCPPARRRRDAGEDCVPGDEGCPPARSRRDAGEDCVPGYEGCPPARRRRNAEEPCSSYNDCGYGYACEGANANKRGVCRGI